MYQQLKAMSTSSTEIHSGEVETLTLYTLPVLLFRKDTINKSKEFENPAVGQCDRELCKWRTWDIKGLMEKLLRESLHLPANIGEECKKRGLRSNKEPTVVQDD
jgi:hypothetical protein